MRPNPDTLRTIQESILKGGWDIALSKLKAEIAGCTDMAHQSELRFFTGWLAAERGLHQEALEQFQALAEAPNSAGWALAGRALIALRQREHQKLYRVLEQALEAAPTDNDGLQAVVSHLRGSSYFHEGKVKNAISELNRALGFGETNPFGIGGILDTFGMIYASQQNFHAARELYCSAITQKEKVADAAGLAISQGNLGRLYLDWGQPARAAEHFHKDLEIADRCGDIRGIVQMYNYLGRAAMDSGQYQDAADWLEESIRCCQGNPGWIITEGYARKDHALALAALGKIEDAEENVNCAAELFETACFAEGLAHVQRVRGTILRTKGEFAAAEEELRAALVHFQHRHEDAEVVRTQLELARTLRARGAPRPLLVRELRSALIAAEKCRRDQLVGDLERELRQVDEAAYVDHAYQRVRGRSLQEDNISLVEGSREHISAMFLDLQGSTAYARGTDPEVVMMTLNQMMAYLAAVLERHDVRVTQYLGDGFMAIIRSTNHPARAVDSALEIQAALQEFNHARRLLGIPLLQARIGIATGEAFIGNVGTYKKSDFTAIGTTINLAARLQTEAEPGVPCISQATYESIHDRYLFKETCPRSVTPKGLGVQQVWDVVRRKENA